MRQLIMTVVGRAAGVATAKPIAPKAGRMQAYRSLLIPADRPNPSTGTMGPSILQRIERIFGASGQPAATASTSAEPASTGASTSATSASTTTPATPAATPATTTAAARTRPTPKLPARPPVADAQSQRPASPSGSSTAPVQPYKPAGSKSLMSGDLLSALKQKLEQRGGPIGGDPQSSATAPAALSQPARQQTGGIGAVAFREKLSVISNKHAPKSPQSDQTQQQALPPDNQTQQDRPAPPPPPPLPTSEQLRRTWLAPAPPPPPPLPTNEQLKQCLRSAPTAGDQTQQSEVSSSGAQARRPKPHPMGPKLPGGFMAELGSVLGKRQAASSSHHGSVDQQPPKG